MAKKSKKIKLEYDAMLPILAEHANKQTKKQTKKYKKQLAKQKKHKKQPGSDRHLKPIPYDPHLLSRVVTQWQFGAWKQIMSVDDEAIHTHPQVGALATLKACALLQLGEEQQARQHLATAKQYIEKDKMAAMLISGVHNSLGRARAANGDDEQAREHFRQAIEVGQPGTDARLVANGRIAEQYSHLEMESSWQHHRPCASGFAPEIIKNISLGLAWSGNTVNTVIFRGHGLLTHEGYQYTAFYVDDQTLRIIQRNLENDQITRCDLTGIYNLKDAHNSISIGVDRRGVLHISYDHHGSRLRYRRTMEPRDIERWTDELVMTGVREEKVTYPYFILPKAGNPLLMLYRDGNWKQGAAYIKSYDEETESWTDYPSPILSGADNKPWTSNAYWNHPAFGNDGVLHLSFTWRTDYSDQEKRINNINIGYARSYDWGRHWFTSNSQACKLPMTQVNNETVLAIPPGANLINQTSMALDSKGYPHIAYYANDEFGVIQYQHLWFDGNKWCNTLLSDRKERFTLQGGGTLQIPTSRPEIVIDKDDDVYVIYRSYETGQRLAVNKLKAPDYQSKDKNPAILWDEPVGYAEPIIDRSRWQEEGILSVMVQYNEQPDGDVMHQDTKASVKLVDMKFQE